MTALAIAEPSPSEFQVNAATGFLTADRELRQLPSGGTVCNMWLAVKGTAPGDRTGYIDIAADLPSPT